MDLVLSSSRKSSLWSIEHPVSHGQWHRVGRAEGSHYRSLQIRDVVAISQFIWNLDSFSEKAALIKSLSTKETILEKNLDLRYKKSGDGRKGNEYWR